MNHVLELRQQRAKLIEDMGQIVARAAAEKRAMTAEETESWERMTSDEKSLRSTIQAAETAATLQSEMESAGARAAARPGDPAAEQRQEQQEEAYSQAFRSYLIGGLEGLEPEQRAILRSGFKQTESRAQSAITGGSGGYTVPQGFRARVEVALKSFGGMRSLAEVITTDSGNDIPMPTNNDTGNKGRLLAENAAITETALTFGQVVLKSWKYSSDLILVPIELLMDTVIDIEQFIANAQATRLGRITNEHFTTGDNTNKPQGVVPASVLGKTGANGQTTSVTYNDLVDLKYSVNSAYRPAAKFSFADTTYKALMKLVDSDNRPLLLSQNVGITAGAPDVLLGHPIAINDDVPVMAANAKSILFGDFRNYKIRDVRSSLILVRFNERYMDNGQVGFVVFSRHDGRMVNAGTDPVKHYANSAT